MFGYRFVFVFRSVLWIFFGFLFGMAHLVSDDKFLLQVVQGYQDRLSFPCELVSLSAVYLAQKKIMAEICLLIELNLNQVVMKNVK